MCCPIPSSLKDWRRAHVYIPMGMNLGKLLEAAGNTEAWCAAVREGTAWWLNNSFRINNKIRDTLCCKCHIGNRLSVALRDLLNPWLCSQPLVATGRGLQRWSVSEAHLWADLRGWEFSQTGRISPPLSGLLTIKRLKAWHACKFIRISNFSSVAYRSRWSVSRNGKPEPYLQLSQGLWYKHSPWDGGWPHAVSRDAEYSWGGSQWSPLKHNLLQVYIIWFLIMVTFPNWLAKLPTV